MADVVLKSVGKIYPGDVEAVADVNLSIADGEFVVLVGPSGCGKSTTLRMIAGLEDVTSGDISIAGRDVTNVEPKDRDIAMVFQSYALYPHMSVRENMEFGLKLRKLSSDVIEETVIKSAKLLDIESLLDRKPKALSGGQRQRVALGRAIVRDPAVFLFDEPLSNLDAKMRVQMRTEISKLHHSLSATMIYVTHDQVEAMTMGTRIVVMHEGKVHQADTPLDIYNHPVNKFVAGFIGSPAMNFISGKLVQDNGLKLVTENEQFSLPAGFKPAEQYIGSEVCLGIRPEHITVCNDGDISQQVQVVEPLGSETLLYFTVAGDMFVVKTDGEITPEVNQEVKFSFDPARIHLFDVNSGEAL
ncbi:sn-glycerol-3-phosphate ABC transporter ATP-binding protein UgpC [bacterium]|nr:sn-glycerol-3-phosphate ABC transporter ATP-binding protein UgpC [bacterium]